MSYEEQQKKEIETIRERKIKVKLSDIDCDILARISGEHGLSVEELIEIFLGDLIGGTLTNGSDERFLPVMYIKQWFERCAFRMFSEKTLLKHLLSCGYDPEDYIDALDNIKTIKENRYISDIETDIAYWEEKMEKMRAGWTPGKEPDMNKEIEFINKWVEERKVLINE